MEIGVGMDVSSKSLVLTLYPNSNDDRLEGHANLS